VTVELGGIQRMM